MLPRGGLRILLRGIHCCPVDKRGQEGRKAAIGVPRKPASSNLLHQYVSFPLSDQIRKNLSFHRIVNVLAYNPGEL